MWNELQQTTFQTDFCLGTNEFHTLEDWVANVEELESCSYSTALDQRFSGSIVPLKHYRIDQRIQSLMIEINRWLYLKEHYSFDSERMRTLIEIQRRVGAALWVITYGVGVSAPPPFFLSKTITHWDNFRANEGCLVSSLNPPSDALALLLFQVEAKPNKYNQ